MNEAMQAIIEFMQGINPLTTKVTDEAGNISVVGRKPRTTSPSAKLKGLFVLNPKPLVQAQLEELVDAYNPSLVVRLSEARNKDGKVFPPMLWVGQDCAEQTDEELSNFMEGL